MESPSAGKEGTSKKLAATRAAFTDVCGLCEVTGIARNELLNVYVLGSMAIDGAATRSSDVDVVAVVADSAKRKWRNVQWLLDHGWLAPPLNPDAYHGFCRNYVGLKEEHAECDVWIYSQSTFRALLLEAAPFAVECICSPLAAKWKDTVEFSLPFDPYTVARSFALVLLAHLRRAGLEWSAHRGRSKSYLSKKCRLVIEPWDLYKSKKTLYFSLRSLHYGQQILCHDKIIDWHSCLDWKRKLLGVSGEAWDAHMEVYKPLHHDLCQSFVAAAETAGIEPFHPLAVDGGWGPDPFHLL